MLRLRLRRPSLSRMPVAATPLAPRSRRPKSLLRSLPRSPRTTRVGGAAGSVARIRGRTPSQGRTPSRSLRRSRSRRRNPRRSSTLTVTKPRLLVLRRCTRVILGIGPSWIGIRTASPATRRGKAWLLLRRADVGSRYYGFHLHVSCHVDCYAHDVAQRIVFHFSYSRFS